MRARLQVPVASVTFISRRKALTSTITCHHVTCIIMMTCLLLVIGIASPGRAAPIVPGVSPNQQWVGNYDSIATIPPNASPYPLKIKSLSVIPPGARNCFPELVMKPDGAIATGNWVGTDCPTQHHDPLHSGLDKATQALHRLESTSLSFLRGIGLGIVSVINGTYTTIRHPNQTVHGLVIAIQHPGITADVIMDQIREEFTHNTAEFLGEALGTLLLPQVAASSALMLTNVGSTTVLRVAVAQDTAALVAESTEMTLGVAHGSNEMSNFGISDREVLKERQEKGRKRIPGFTVEAAEAEPPVPDKWREKLNVNSGAKSSQALWLPNMYQGSSPFDYETPGSVSSTLNYPLIHDPSHYEAMSSYEMPPNDRII